MNKSCPVTFLISYASPSAPPPQTCWPPCHLLKTSGKQRAPASGPLHVLVPDSFHRYLHDSTHLKQTNIFLSCLLSKPFPTVLLSPEIKNNCCAGLICHCSLISQKFPEYLPSASLILITALNRLDKASSPLDLLLVEHTDNKQIYNT